MTKVQYKTDKSTLINKKQLNTIITNKDGSPDYLAINLYFDTFRSWYGSKGYNKDGNVYHIKKLKTPGIFLNYKELSQIHGCSKETIRRKIVKLEELCLIHRSFQHKKTHTTESYNHLIIYVWQDTPYFYNHMGIDIMEVSKLNPQTNYKYIEEKYNVSFAENLPQEQAVLIGGGIHTCGDTKELNNISLSKDIDLESNFFQNSKKAKVYHFNQYKEPQNLKHHYPLNNEDCANLQSKCGRSFSLNAMNEILLDMSRRVDRKFRSKAQFLDYFGKSLRYEKRDAVKTDNVNFRIKANITEEERQYAKRESFLSRAECKVHDLENRTTDGFQKVSVLGILDKLQIY
jgi:hypothetical protein